MTPRQEAISTAVTRLCDGEEGASVATWLEETVGTANIISARDAVRYKLLSSEPVQIVVPIEDLVSRLVEAAAGRPDQDALVEKIRSFKEGNLRFQDLARREAKKRR